MRAVLFVVCSALTAACSVELAPTGSRASSAAAGQTSSSGSCGACDDPSQGGSSGSSDVASGGTAFGGASGASSGGFAGISAGGSGAVGGASGGGGSSPTFLCGADPSCPHFDPNTCLCLDCFSLTCDDNTDCVCEVCHGDPYCATPASCNNDGVCDPYNEVCECPDCAYHPFCT